MSPPRLSWFGLGWGQWQEESSLSAYLVSCSLPPTRPCYCSCKPTPMCPTPLHQWPRPIFCLPFVSPCLGSLDSDPTLDPTTKEIRCVSDSQGPPLLPTPKPRLSAGCSQRCLPTAATVLPFPFSHPQHSVLPKSLSYPLSLPGRPLPTSSFPSHNSHSPFPWF